MRLGEELALGVEGVTLCAGVLVGWLAVAG